MKRLVSLFIALLVLGLGGAALCEEGGAPDVVGTWYVSEYRPLRYGTAVFAGHADGPWWEIRADGTMTTHAYPDIENEFVWQIDGGRLMVSRVVDGKPASETPDKEYAVIQGDALVRTIAVQDTVYAVTTMAREPGSDVLADGVALDSPDALDGNWKVVLYGVDDAFIDPSEIKLDATAEMADGVLTVNFDIGGHAGQQVYPFQPGLADGMLRAVSDDGSMTAFFSLRQDGRALLQVGLNTEMMLMERVD